ncbi:carboxypeptidase-like regulatory domain-containing protein, partial [Bacteroides cellulosilyticus]|uniref:carboxypeptidase-like regulatory domain-containing protein n=5 Tax=Bacteroides TaxID=816 RepID=UPI0018ABCDC8
MEKQENFCKRQAQKLCRLFPVAILLFLFLSVPLKGYSNETFSLEGVQQNTIKVIGTVKDTNGEPIIGANVMVVGSATGVITDIDGNFVLNAPAGSKLQFSFIGYKEQVVPVKKGISLKIVLEEDSQMLGEVEVVAYGVQKKVSVTGAISSMKGDDLLKTPAGSISNILSGQV